MRLDDVRGFVFDVDGSLVHRDADFRARPLPGAARVLDAIRASGRPLVLFTNGSHVGPEAFAKGLRDDGLPVGDHELLTPVCSALSYLARRHPGRPLVLFTNGSHVGPEAFAKGLRDDGLPVGDHELLTPVCSALSYLARRHSGRPAMVFGSDNVRERMAAAGVPLVDGEEAEVVFVAHIEEVDLAAMERAARAVSRGARLLTANYQRGYWGANGIVFSRGAMVTAAIARVTGARPVVVGKPSRAAVREISDRLGVPSQRLAVIGDDLGMDIALGRLGGSRTILVRSGISGSVDLSRVPESRRPDAVVDGVEEMLGWL